MNVDELLHLNPEITDAQSLQRGQRVRLREPVKPAARTTPADPVIDIAVDDQRRSIKETRLGGAWPLNVSSTST